MAWRRQGEDLRRFCRRLERLRLHYSPSVQVPEVMAESKQLDTTHEESDDSSEIDLYIYKVLDPDYNPFHDLSSSSEDGSEKTPVKAFYKLSSEEDDYRIDETPTSTSECVPQRERTRGREEEEEDGGYDASEDQSSDIDVLDLSQGRRWDEDQPQKKKVVMKKTDGMADLSPQRACEPRREDEKKRGKSKKKKEKVVVKKTDGMADLSPQSAREPRREDEKKRGKSKKEKKEKVVVKKTELPKQKVRRPWSEAERAAVNRHMSRFTAERRVPRKEDCVRCLMKEKSLKRRSWKDVKNFVYNTVVTLNRRSVTRKLNY